MSLRWNFAEIADQLGSIFATIERELRLEQAVYGLDTRDEKALQKLLAERLSAQFGVAREVHYPSTRGRKLTHRPRCDVVLMPHGCALEPETVPERTLFDPVPGEPSAPRYCAPADALWLEVKVAYQFREGGLRHGGYGAQWRQNVVADLRKMESDEGIREAGLVLIVFNESRDVLDKDLELFEDVLAQKEVLAGFRQVRCIPILDRIGHQICSVAVWPTIQR